MWVALTCRYRCKACEAPSPVEAEMIGLACPSCAGGAVVPNCACAENTVSQLGLAAGSGNGACTRHADIACMSRLQREDRSPVLMTVHAALTSCASTNSKNTSERWSQVPKSNVCRGPS